VPKPVSPTLALRKSGLDGGRSLNSAASEVCVNPRTLRKWDGGHATPPDNVVKLLAYVVGLDTLEALERAGPVALTEALGGDLSVSRLRAYLESVFDAHDPLTERETDP
jgi:hypothetical protein